MVSETIFKNTVNESRIVTPERKDKAGVIIKFKKLTFTTKHIRFTSQIKML